MEAFQIIDSDPHYLFLDPSQVLVPSSNWNSILGDVKDLQYVWNF